MKPNLVKAAAVLLAFVVVFYFGFWQWGICRVYVEAGETLMVSSKFGKDNPRPDIDRVVDQGTKGVWREVFGEGRYFFNPVEYKTETTKATADIGPEQVGIVESMSGESLKPGQFLAKDGQMGILERPLTPGKWRLNPIATKVTPVPAVQIQPGAVGVVMHLSGEDPPAGVQLAEPHQRGILKNVLQPGIYYLNPREYKVVEVEAGYQEITIEDVTFPSKDGFTIKLDVTVVWGLLPKNLPTILARFGDTKAVIDKIIRPQIESICRIEGSKYGAKDFIEGSSREQFQKTFTSQLHEETQVRNIDLLIALVRDIDVPIELRLPIQQAKIAAEEQLTKEEQRKTQTVENELQELKSEVEKGVREVGAETQKTIAEARANGEKKVATTRGEQEVAIADILRQVADLEAERERILGKADADVIEMMQKAEADRFQKNVQALGDPEAYANYIFATKLPDDLKIYLRYAGPGTFWTDLPQGMKDFERAASLKMLEKIQREEK